MIPFPPAATPFPGTARFQSENDTFTVTASGTVSGGVSGNENDDLFTFTSGTLTATVSGNANNDTFNFAGGSLTCTLSGNNENDTFSATANGTLSGGVSRNQN